RGRPGRSWRLTLMSWSPCWVSTVGGSLRPSRSRARKNLSEGARPTTATKRDCSGAAAGERFSRLSPLRAGGGGELLGVVSTSSRDGPVTFVTRESISTLPVDLLSAELSLTQTVSQVPSGDVAPPTGGETTLRAPVPREAKIQPRGANLDYTEIDEVPVDFSIDHICDGARVTEHRRSLDSVDFGRQVTRNQVRAVVAGAERQLASVMNALPIGEEVTPDGSDFDNVIADANALLDEAENPMENRWLAVSPRFAARLTSPDGVTLTDFQGEVATEALRQGILGEYRGFIVVK